MDRGFALVEVMVSAVIAVLGVLGLAYSFSVGRVQVDRFEVARAALAVAQQRMELLSVLAGNASELTIGQHPTSAFVYDGASGGESWKVDWYDDPGATGTKDLKRVTVQVAWTQGALSDTVRLSRLFYPL
jgi:type II secretory pathway pseudopilin PulG